MIVLPAVLRADDERLKTAAAVLTEMGATDTDVIMLVMNDRGVDRMLSSRFTVGADAAVAAGPVGRQAPRKLTRR
jgi:lipid-binding SYLF domain-containing protein